MRVLGSEERSAWLDRLREAVDRWGFSTFVRAPLLEPTDRFFPDRYTPDQRGVRTVARRLMRYAGLGELSVHLAGSDRADTDRLAQTVVVLSGAETNAVELTVHALGRAEDVPLVLAHEVARAYRLLRRRSIGAEHPYRTVQLEEDDVEPDAGEEEEVSLTAFYLGFAVLATKGALQYAAAGDLHGIHVVTRWAHRTIGALPPTVACFLLAAQCVVRGIDPASLSAHLGADDRALLARYAGELDPEATRAALGLPPESEWPAPVEPSEPLEDDGWEPEPIARRDASPNEGRPVFRRLHSRAFAFAATGGAVGLAGSVALAVVAPSSAILGAALVAVLAVAGFVAGKRVRAGDRCSDPWCEADLPPGLPTCPRCGGTVCGEIGERESHLAAVERSGVASVFGALRDESADDASPHARLGVKCPACGWIPDGEAHWICDDCPGHSFDTFATRARCDRCGRTFEETGCPACGHLVPHDFWWPAPEEAVRDP